MSFWLPNDAKDTLADPARQQLLGRLLPEPVTGFPDSSAVGDRPPPGS